MLWSGCDNYLVRLSLDPVNLKGYSSFNTITYVRFLLDQI